MLLRTKKYLLCLLALLCVTLFAAVGVTCFTQSGKTAYATAAAEPEKAAVAAETTPVAELYVGEATTPRDTYNTLEEAILASNINHEGSNCRIELLNDATVNVTLEIERKMQTYSTTIALNGYQIRLAEGKTGSVIKINAGAIVQIFHKSGKTTNAVTKTGTHTIKNPNNNEPVDITGSLITGGNAVNDGKGVGGGIYLENCMYETDVNGKPTETVETEGGFLRLNANVWVAGNKADFGGGIRAGDNATLILANGASKDDTVHIAYNAATFDGGGICAYKSKINNWGTAKIHNNSAKAGGGVYFENKGSAASEYSSFTNFDGTEIYQNTVTTDTADYTGNGGGIYIDGGGAECPIPLYGQTIEGASIHDNSATKNGAGVYVANGGSLKVGVYATVYGNTVGGKNSNVYLDDGTKMEIGIYLRETENGIGVSNTGIIATGFTETNANGLNASQVFKPDDSANDCVWISDAATGTVHIGHTPDAASGICPNCNKAFAALVTAGESNTYYETFGEAWTAAINAGTATIKMFADATVNETLVVSKGANITLNLHNCVLALTKNASGSVIKVEGAFTTTHNAEDSLANHTIIDPVTKTEQTIKGGFITGGKGTAVGSEKWGGGVYVANGGTFVMSGGAVAGNTADYGGGVYVGNNATFETQMAARIIYNKATMVGGGICFEGAKEISIGGISSIENNRALAGGGIYFRGTGDGDYIINGGAHISDNSVSTDADEQDSGKGGGIYIDGSSVLLNGDNNFFKLLVSRNDATKIGGGVYVGKNSTLKAMGKVYISENKKGGKDDNVYLEGSSKITVCGAMNADASICINNTGAVVTGFTETNNPDNLIAAEVFIPDGETDDCVWISDAATGAVSIGTHTGGAATCQKKAVCEQCNEEYGELATDHNYVNGICTECGVKQKIYWGVTNSTLTISGSEADVAEAANSGSFAFDLRFEDSYQVPWRKDNVHVTITDVIIGDGVAPLYLRRWFEGFTALANIDLSKLDTSNVVEMINMFSNCTSLTSLDLSGFDFSNVVRMDNLFDRCNSLTSITFPETVNAEKVTYMSNMFYQCKALTNLDLSAFKTKELITLSGMFQGCESLTTVTFPKTFDTSKVINMETMFFASGVETLDLSTFDTSSLKYTKSMFGSSKLTSVNISSFDKSSLTDMSSMFMYCKDLTTVIFPERFDISGVTTMQYMFMGCEKLTSLKLPAKVIQKEQNATVKTDMSYMFNGCKALTSLDLSAFDTSNATTMRSMFSNCEKLTSLNLSSLNTSKVTDMYYMFNGCKALPSLDVSSFNTVNVTTMSCMFSGCSALKSLDLSSFDTTNVTNMSSMFYDCQNLTSVNVSSFNTEKVTNMAFMFNVCKALPSLDLSSFDISGVTDATNIFSSCDGLNELKTPKTMSTKTLSLPDGTTDWWNGTALIKASVTSADAGKTLKRHPAHTGGTATCQTKAVCEICGMEYGELGAHDFENGEYVKSNTEHWKKCKNCTAQDTDHKESHSGGTATCITVAHCEKCGFNYGGLGDHSLTHNEAHNATCTEDGNIEYWQCGDCENYFSDAAGNNEIELSDTVINKSGHDIVNHEAKAATCTEKGWNAYDTCSRCNHSTYSETAALGHDFASEFTVDKQPTCTEKGSKSKHCSRCGEKSEVTEIALSAHSLTHVPAKEATENAVGNIEYWACTDCAQYFTDEAGDALIADKTSVIIPALVPDDGGLSGGAVAGISVGAVIVSLIAAYIVCYFVLYRKGVLLKGKVWDVIYTPMNLIFIKNAKE